MKLNIIFLLLILLNSCNNKHEEKNEFLEKEILCDSIYPNKSYIVNLKYFSNKKSYHFYDKNAVVKISKFNNGNYKEILCDTIESHSGNIEFHDFNGDNVKDILVQNLYIKGNQTFYLYVVDLNKDKITKIENFDDIINPRYLSEYDLIDNKVRTFKDWTTFYMIKYDSIINFGKEHGNIMYWEKEKNGQPKKKSKVEYNQLLKKIIKVSKNYR